MTQQDHKVLGLDLASETGHSVFANGVFSWGHKKFVRRKGRKTIPDDHIGIKFHDFRNYLKELIYTYKITMIAYEEPAGRASSMQALYGLRGVMMDVACKRDIIVKSIYPSTLKKWATGNGHASKYDMMKVLNEKHGFAVSTHDEADAVFLVLWARSTFALDIK